MVYMECNCQTICAFKELVDLDTFFSSLVKKYFIWHELKHKPKKKLKINKKKKKKKSLSFEF